MYNQQTYPTSFMLNQDQQFKTYENYTSQNRLAQPRYSNNYEPRPLQEHNQYTSRTNKSPIPNNVNDEMTFQKTRTRIEELQGIINELQANRHINRRITEQIKPLESTNYMTGYKTECPSRAISQNRQQSNPNNNVSLSPMSFRGQMRAQNMNDYSTNHPNNIETWLTQQKNLSHTNEFASPLKSHLNTAAKPEKSRMFTPVPAEDSPNDNKFSDLFTRYISNVNIKQQAKQASPKFNGEDDYSSKQNYRPSVSPIQNKAPQQTNMYSNQRPSQIMTTTGNNTETTDFASQLTQFLHLHRDNLSKKDEEDRYNSPLLGTIVSQRPSLNSNIQPQQSSEKQQRQISGQENQVCVSLAQTQHSIRKSSDNSPTPQRITTNTAISKVQPKNENIQSQQSIVGSVLPDSMIVEDLDSFNLGKVLGLGSYAVVRLCIHKPTGQSMAIKTYEKSKLQDPQKRKNVSREMKILSKLRHTNIIKLHQAAETATQLHLIMEYTSSNSLNTYIKSCPKKKLDEDEAKQIFRQVLDAIRYCHHKNVVHRDIKLENILIDEKKQIKLIDFGYIFIEILNSFSIAIDPSTKLNVFCGTPSYMAPEIVNKIQYGFPADVWALGILLFKMTTGTFPFRGADDKELYRKINSGKIEFPQNFSSQGKSLIQRLLRVNQQDRPTSKDLLQDEWFTCRSQNSMEEECQRVI